MITEAKNPMSIKLRAAALSGMDAAVTLTPDEAAAFADMMENVEWLVVYKTRLAVREAEYDAIAEKAHTKLVENMQWGGAVVLATCIIWAGRAIMGAL